AGYKRAVNILRIEEKKDGKTYSGGIKLDLLQLNEERQLANAILEAKLRVTAAVDTENFNGAMAAISELRPHVDAFFDKVTVNVTDGADAANVRENRLKLLNEIRAATRAVADFSKIEG